MSKTEKTIVIILTLISVLCLGYPKIAVWWNEYTVSKVVQGYTDGLDTMSETKIREEFQKADKYNDDLKQGITDENEYASILQTKSGVMGYLSVPAIDLKLPIYHGTSSESITNGAGHMEDSSFPVGGESTHAVLSSHCGMPDHVGFTNLDKVKKGDLFQITVLDKTLTYKVDQIKIVKPSNDKDIQIVDGKDYVTLLTCYPYGINSHRLLVRGHRVANPESISQKQANLFEFINNLSFQTKMVFTTIIVTSAIIIAIKVIQRIHH